MTARYATGRVYLDADSHVVETEEWLAPFADPALRDRIRGRSTSARAAASWRARRWTGRERRAEAGGSALREGDTVMSAKGWPALGRVRQGRAHRALDLLGFHRQLVFSTFAPTQFESDRDLDLLYGGRRRADPGDGRLLRRRRPADAGGARCRCPTRRAASAASQRGDRPRLPDGR